MRHRTCALELEDLPDGQRVHDRNSEAFAKLPASQAWHGPKAAFGVAFGSYTRLPRAACPGVHTSHVGLVVATLKSAGQFSAEQP